jgi:hypothetical protein
VAEDVVAGLVGGGGFGEVVGGVTFAFPVGQIGAGEHEVLARTVRSVVAVLAEGAVRATDHRPVTAQAVLDQHHGEVDPRRGRGRVVGVHVGRAEQDRAGLVHAGPGRPHLLQVPGHAVVVVVGVVRQRLRREVPQQLAYQRGRRAVVQQRRRQRRSGLMGPFQPKTFEPGDPDVTEPDLRYFHNEVGVLHGPPSSSPPSTPRTSGTRNPMGSRDAAVPPTGR